MLYLSVNAPLFTLIIFITTYKITTLSIRNFREKNNSRFRREIRLHKKKKKTPYKLRIHYSVVITIRQIRTERWKKRQRNERLSINLTRTGADVWATENPPGLTTNLCVVDW